MIHASYHRTNACRQARSRGGAALLACIFMVALGAAMVTAVLNSETSDMAVLRNTLDYERAYYMAAAGVNHALAELENDYGWRTGVPATEFPAGSGQSYSATAVDGTGIAVTVTGVGVAGGVTRTLTISVEPGL